MFIDADFRKFNEECEKDDSETRECENQRKLENIDKIVNVVKSTRSRKAPRYICHEALATDHFDQCTILSVCEKAEKTVQEFCSKQSELKKYFQRRLPARLLVSRQEAGSAYSMNAYLEKMNSSLNC